MNPCRDDASFTSSKTEPWVLLAISKYYVSGLVAAKKDCSWCHISVENESVLGVAVWQRVGGDDLHAPTLFLCPVTQNHIALFGWLTAKEIHLG